MIHGLARIDRDGSSSGRQARAVDHGADDSNRIRAVVAESCGRGASVARRMKTNLDQRGLNLNPVALKRGEREPVGPEPDLCPDDRARVDQDRTKDDFEPGRCRLTPRLQGGGESINGTVETGATPVEISALADRGSFMITPPRWINTFNMAQWRWIVNGVDPASPLISDRRRIHGFRIRPLADRRPHLGHHRADEFGRDEAGERRPRLPNRATCLMRLLETWEYSPSAIRKTVSMVGVEPLVGHGHGEFVLHVGEGPEAAEDDPGADPRGRTGRSGSSNGSTDTFGKGRRPLSGPGRPAPRS